MIKLDLIPRYLKIVNVVHQDVNLGECHFFSSITMPLNLGERLLICRSDYENMSLQFNPFINCLICQF